MIRALAPAVQTALRALAQHAAPRDRKRLREAGRRGMGPTPAIRRARARVLAAISAAERRRRAAVRAGDGALAARWQGEATRLRRRLARLDARWRTTVADPSPAPGTGTYANDITRKEEPPDGGGTTTRASGPVGRGIGPDGISEGPSAQGRGAGEEEKKEEETIRPVQRSTPHVAGPDGCDRGGAGRGMQNLQI